MQFHCYTINGTFGIFVILSDFDSKIISLVDWTSQGLTKVLP